MVTRASLSRALGAAFRAAAMALIVAVPQLVLGGEGEGTRQIWALFALLAAAFTAVEYASSTPSLVEFRDAPPYNRLRAMALLASVLATSLVLRAGEGDGTFQILLRLLAERMGEGLDLPYMPVHLVVLALPDSLDPDRAVAIRSAAAAAWVVSLAMAMTFVLILRLRGWPTTRRFNVWVNLPQFDPTAGGDVVERLQSEANVNLSLGFLLPFLVPVAAGFLSSSLENSAFAQPTALAWLVTAWAFLPASLLMRGVALHRVAGMILAQRQRAYDAEWQPA